jgi:hypothetical protein
MNGDKMDRGIYNQLNPIWIGLPHELGINPNCNPNGEKE